MSKYKGENFSTEIVSLITETFDDDEQLMIDILKYLYETSEDDYMKTQIVNVFNKRNYCIDCCSKLQYYEWDEVHTELDYNNVERCGAMYCPICDSYEIEDIKGGF